MLKYINKENEELVRAALEKADRNAEGFNYEERESAQNAALNKAFLARGIKTKHNPEGNEVIVVFALLYSLSNMHNDTYIDLVGTKNPHFSRLKLINNFINQLTGSQDVAAILQPCIDELIEFEGHRPAVRCTTLEKHAEKKARFDDDMKSLLSDKRFQKNSLKNFLRPLTDGNLNMYISGGSTRSPGASPVSTCS